MFIHSTRESNPMQPHWGRSLGSALLCMLLISSTLLLLVHSRTFVQADSSSFVFTAAGDYGSTQNTVNNLQFIGKSAADGGPGAAFNLGLGDYSYDTTISADTWYTTYVQSNLPPAFPFEIVSGDHDMQLSQLTADLPPNGITLGNQSTAYGQEYYFDYPPTNPLARVLMLTPRMLLPNGQQVGYSYAQGTKHYNWVLQITSDARAAGIPWVIVGMARGCLFIGSSSTKQTCRQQDYDLLNMLLSKDANGHPHADLILQAHLHYYARSYQLSINTNCPSLPIVPAAVTDQFNPNCVVDQSSNLSKDAGTVIVDTGTGGQSLVSIDGPGTDPRANYFASSMGGNSVNAGYGVSQFTVSANQLAMTYDLVTQTKGVTPFGDTFSITNNAGISTPSPTTSPSVVASATPSPGMTLAQDSFQRANQTYWGSASDGQMWGGDANSSSRFSILNDTGQVSTMVLNSYGAILGPVVANAEVLFSGSISSFTGSNIGAMLHWTDSQDWYKAYIDGTKLVIQKKVNGTLVKLGSVPFAATAGTSYTLDFNATGSTLSARVWPTNGIDPGSWMLTVQDSDHPSGNCGLHTLLPGGDSVTFTAFQATYQ